MDNIIEYTKLNEETVYDQLKVKLEGQKLLDIVDIEENVEVEYLEDDLKKNNDLYDLYREKLDISNELYQDENDLKKYHEIIYKIDCLPDLSKAQKIQMMIGYGVLATKKYVRVKNLGDSELFMLSAFSAKLDLDDYNLYVGILSETPIAEAITGMDNSIIEQFKIASSIRDSIDALPDISVDPDNWEQFIKIGMSTINNYEKSYTK